MVRKTQQRKAIWDVITHVKRPLSPQEICEFASKKIARLGIATVYRTIKALQEKGELIAVDIPGHPLRYERSGLKHHHHFFCTLCDRVFEMEPGCPDNLSRLAPKGFEVENHHLVLSGQCLDCQGKNSV